MNASDAALTRRRIGYLAVLLLAYVPPLRTHPGRVAADTKQYLYVDPARVLGRAAAMWDPNIGFGTVTHQNIGYLFPMGPYYWLLERIGVPDWVAQRLWLGTLVAAAGFGVIYLLRALGMRGPGVPVAVLAYMFGPYSLHYAARISVLLGPWAALPWLIALTVKALRRGGWRYPALFALVVQLVGGVNATALVFAGVGPVLWIAWQWLGTREVGARDAIVTTLKIGGLSLVASLWWIAGLSLQGGYGLDILRYTETVKAVARTSTPNEVLRGLGYWFFYGRDRIGPWIEAATNYTQRPRLIFTGYSIAAASLFSAAFVRWRQRGYFVLLTLVGVVIAVGAFPYAHPTPLGSLFKNFANSSSAGLALRSTGRADPLVVLGLAVLLGAGVSATATWLAAREWRRGLAVRIGGARLGALVACLVGLVVLSNFPALYDETYYGSNLERDEDLPSAWTQAARYLDSLPHSTRVLELPGSDFASYRFGMTVDPITPGMIDRPYVARELIPYGSAPSADMLNALDRRLQEGVFDPRGFADLLRRAGVGEVVLRNDIEWDRYNLIRPRELARALAAVPGLVADRSFGPRVGDQTAYKLIDERTLNPVNLIGPEARQIVMLKVLDPVPIVRGESAEAAVVVAGDGEGLVDAADAGALSGSGPVLYSAPFQDDAAALRKAAGPNGLLVLTDANRQRARRWSTVLDNTGYTERAGERPLVTDVSDARLPLFPDADSDASTVTETPNGDTVRATAYGNPISYTPEDRPTRAFDGDRHTAWSVGAFDRVVGQRIELATRAPITTDHVNLSQILEGPRDRFMTRVRLRFDGGAAVDRVLDRRSRVVGGQTLEFGRRTFSNMTIEILDTNKGDGPLYSGDSAVGFAEVRLADEHDRQPIRVAEVVRMPRDLLAAFGRDSTQHPLVVTLTRLRGREVPPRSDEEVGIDRVFDLPEARDVALTGDARVFGYAIDPRTIDAELGTPDGVRVVAHQFLPGCLACRGAAAIDGDPNTAWQTPVNAVVKQWLAIDSPEPMSFDHLDLSVLADGRHSLPTRLRIDVDGQQREVAVPRFTESTRPGNVSSVRVPLPRLRGKHLRVTISAIHARRALSYYAGDYRLQMPVGIAELGVPGLRGEPLPSRIPAACRTDLLTVNGKRIPVRVIGSTSDALLASPLRVELCQSALHLRAGRNTVTTARGLDKGLSIDRLFLSSAAGGRAAPLRAVVGERESPPSVEVGNGRTSFTAHVRGADEPFWLVLGQSNNRGWQAKVVADRNGKGQDLGAPVLVDGYANGWRVDPRGRRDFDVAVTWAPQQRVWIALLLSVVGALLCLGIVVVSLVRGRGEARLKGREEAVVLIAPWRRAGGRVRGGTLVLTALGAAAVAALVVAPWAGLLVGICVAAALRWRRAEGALALAGPTALFLVGLYIARNQIRFNFPAVFEWPTLFPRMFAFGWLAAVLPAAAWLVAHVRERSGSHAASSDAATAEANTDTGAAR